MTIRQTVFASLILALHLVPADAATRNYFSPEVEGSRLDACISAGQACGKPAADAFCKAQGYANAIIFQREPATLTRSLDSGQICENGNCTSFRQIKCFSENAAAEVAVN